MVSTEVVPQSLVTNILVCRLKEQFGSASCFLINRTATKDIMSTPPMLLKDVEQGSVAEPDGPSLAIKSVSQSSVRLFSVTD